MPASLKDHLISMQSKNSPSVIFRTLVRAMIDNEEIFRANADKIKEMYPIVHACKCMILSKYFLLNFFICFLF